MWINYRGYQDGFTQFRSLNIGNGKSANIAYFDGATSTASIGNGQTVTSQYRLYVNGAFAATSKSFKIPHPTKENHDLVYGSLEGPEHGVYVRGKSSDVIELPDYWVALVDENTITVQLTPIGNHMSWVEKIEDNKILIGGGEAFYFVQAMRKDIEPLEVEVELPVEEEV
jgi:prepilin-type processing-associated H-X9-DG protein